MTHSTSRIVTIAALLGMALLAPAAGVGATPPISGQTIEFDGTATNVGSHTDWVYSVAVGDLDGDGDLDTVSGGFDNTVNVWQNDGAPFSDGTWASQEVGSHTFWVRSLAVGDLDGDGDLDIVSGGDDSKVNVWQNDGSPFTGPWTSQEVGSHPHIAYSVAVGDLDGDGDLDIVSGGADSKVSVWRNDGTPFTGTWTKQEAGSHTEWVQSVAVGDLDGDGDLDLVSGGRDDKVNAWQNDGNPFSGVWTKQEVGSHTDNVWSLAVGDLDGDGDLDIVSGGRDDKVNVWQNDGTPFSGDWTQQEVGSYIYSMESVSVGDLDGDGDLDIVSGTARKVNAWQNDGNPFSGDWTQQEVGNHGGWVSSVAMGDLDGDGDLDIVSGGEDHNVNAWQNVQVHRNAPFDSTAQNVGSHTSFVHSMAVGDLDGDGDLDPVSGGADGKVNAWHNDGNPFGETWPKQEVGSHTDYVHSVAVGDLDGDGDLDVVSGGRDDKVNIWQNDGNPFGGTWTQQEVGSHGYFVFSVAVGDLDGDGDLDIASGGADDKVNAWRNDGSPFNGTWAQQEVGGNTAMISVAVGDLDGDGDLDIVSGGYENEVNAWQNDGTPFSGTWTQQGVGNHTYYVASVAVGDLDGDGDLDIVSGGADSKVNVWQNDSTPFSGTWTQQEVGSHWNEVLSVAAGDLDGDEDLDIVSGTWGEVNVWQNDGMPFNDAWTKKEAGSHATNWVYSVAVGDLDGDGDLDIASGGGDTKVNAWRNQGGSAGLAITDTSPDTILISTEDDLLKVVFTHNGIAGDRDLELNTFNLDLFRSDCSTPLTSAEANAIIANLRVRLDDGDDIFETDGSDVLVADVDTLSLDSGVQTVAFSDGDANAQVSATGGKTTWVSVLTTADASSQAPNCLCANFDPDADALVEGKTPDFSVSTQDTVATDTGGVCATGGTIQVCKDVVPDDGSLWDFTLSGATSGTKDDLGDGQCHTWSGLGSGSYTLSEATQAGYDAAVDCGAKGSDGDNDITFTLDSGDNVTCTFTNSRQGSIRVCKDVVPDDGSLWDFTLSGATSGTKDDLGDGQCHTWSGLGSGSYTLSEATQAGYDAAVDCGAKGSDSDNDITFALNSGDNVTCTFSNTAQPGSITVVKQVVGATPADDWSFSGGLGSFTLPAAGGQLVFTDQAAGDYTITETAKDGYAVSVVCDSDESGSNSVTVNLDPGEDVTCTFSNTAQPGTIIVEKQTEPDGATDTFTFSGDAAGSIKDGEQIVVSDLLPGTYTSQETVPAGWELMTITCDDGNSTGDVGTGKATFNLEAGETVKCTFSNKLKRGTIIVEKQTEPDGAAGSFTFSGDAAGTVSDGETIVVSDLLPGTYTATEDDPTPAFDLTAITCDDGGSATPSSGDVGTRRATFNLDPGETVKCTFTNILKQFTLTVDKAGIGTGTVTSDPVGIDCGGDCMGNYYYDTVVTLTAVPGLYSFFVSWGEDCSGTNPLTTVTMDADKTCAATFGYTWKVHLPLITKGTP